MGQYYVPVLLDDAGKPKGHFSSHHYGSGLKLMEHSWMDNGFVHAVEVVLALDGAQRLVWAGDYADPEPGTTTEDNPHGVTIWSLADETPEIIPDTPGLNSASYMEPVEPTLRVPPEMDDTGRRFLVNHDRREYVDKGEVPLTRLWNPPCAIHPLPLLTCEGNGRGGGDFRDPDPNELVGRWARQRISVGGRRPGDEYRELTFDLTEN